MLYAGVIAIVVGVVGLVAIPMRKASPVLGFAWLACVLAFFAGFALVFGG